ncbi:hypothetical protein LJR153_003479 [Paenibacillus sp. LjRoot153]|uniref:hypothetical protein n=1 Tax=Paenibacillus sp. LjRoot153 TaxID=3342270 RepID=UPI003ED0CB0A
MKEMFFAWIFGLVMMAGCGFFVYRPLKDAMKHAKNYRTEKKERRLLWWYLEWPIVILDVIGKPGRPNMILFLIGTLIFVVFTIKIVGRLLGYHLLE